MTVAPSERPAPPRAAGQRLSLFSWLLLVLGTLGFAAFWALAAIAFDRQLGWMAVLGALDLAWMLRLGGWRPGWKRAAAAMSGTALIVLIANWGIVAGQLSGPFGLGIVDSAGKLGPNLFWTLFQLANGGVELMFMAAALAVAALTAR